MILCAGAGVYSTTKIYETEGIYLPLPHQTPEQVLTNLSAIDNPSGQRSLRSAVEQTKHFIAKAKS